MSSRFASRASLASAALVATVLFGAGFAQAAARTEARGLFGYREIPHAALDPFPKWTGAMERYFKEKSTAQGSCEGTQFNRCHYQTWSRLIARLRGDPPDVQLNKINNYMNVYRYIVDPINWGMKDYWATPGQFFKKFGDCEDYAIAKYFSLRALGWDADKLRIVVLYDTNLAIAHAILAVRLGGREFVLDNQIAIVVDAARIKHYRPIYSVNENGWWRHRAVRKTRPPLRRRAN